MLARHQFLEGAKKIGVGYAILFAIACLPPILTDVLASLLPPGRPILPPSWMEWIGWWRALMWLTIFIGLPAAAWLVYWWWKRVRDPLIAASKLGGEEGTTVLLLPRAARETQKLEDILFFRRLGLGLLSTGEHVSLELTGGEDGVMYSLRANKERTLRLVAGDIMSEWRGSQIRMAGNGIDPDPLSTAALLHDGWWVEVAPAAVTFPVRASAQDPMLALLRQISRLKKGMMAGLVVQVRPDVLSREALVAQYNALIQPKYDPKGRLIRAPKTVETMRLEDGLKERIKHAVLETRVLLWAAMDGAGSATIAKETARDFARSLCSYYTNENPLSIIREGEGVPAERSFPINQGAPWAENELITLFHLPGIEAREVSEQLRMAPARQLTPARAIRIPDHAWVVAPVAQRKAVDSL